MHQLSFTPSRPLPVRLIVLLFTTLLLLLSAVSFAQGSAEVNERVLRVVGHGVVYGQPDMVTLELGLTATDPDVRAAVEQIDAGMKEVLAALSRLGVAERDIRTTAYNIWREEQFGREGEGRSQAVFRAQHMIAVELEGAVRASEVLAAAVEAGANAVGGINFGFSNPEELEAQARAAAVEDARVRANQLAAAAAVGLGEPVVIEEITTQAPPGPYFERSAVAMDAAPISPGQLSVEVRVAVSYRIE